MAGIKEEKKIYLVGIYCRLSIYYDIFHIRCILG